MATVTQHLDVGGAIFRSTASPALVQVDGTSIPVRGLAFDATNDEAAFWSFIATSYGSGNLTVRVYWYADTATTGNVVWEAQIAAITPNTDSQDIETDALATLNFVQDTHLGTTGQRLHSADITVSNLDSLAAGDHVFLRLARDANGTNATDDMAGDAIVVLVTVSYSDTP